MRLEQAGIARSDMEVHAGNLAGDKTGTSGTAGTLGATDRQVVSERTIANDGEDVGVITKIEHFFGKIFGGDERGGLGSSDSLLRFLSGRSGPIMLPI